MSEIVCGGLELYPRNSHKNHTSYFTYTDGGKTLTITGTGTVDGEKQDDQNDVWRRVSKQQKLSV